MPTWKELSIYVFGILLIAVMFSMVVGAAGSQFKDSVCAACHNDASVILPKAPHPASDKEAACVSCHAQNPADKGEKKFVIEIHKIHQGEKTNIDCFACHPKA